MNARTCFTLRDDVAILALDEIEDSVRQKLDCGPGDHVISQFQGRAPSMLVDASTAEFLRGFKTAPMKVAEAVLRFSLSRQLDPEETLEATLPLVERLVRQGLLVDADDAEARQAARQSFWPDDRIEGLRIVRPIRVLDDVELYLVRSGSGFAALKLFRDQNSGRSKSEADLLRHLAGREAPRLFAQGMLESGGPKIRPYLLMEWCHGVNCRKASAEGRQRPGPGGRSLLLALCRTVAGAFARLHELDVLHGDVHPDNVLVDRHGLVRIVDFGLARRASGEAEEPFKERPGVPFYFEPEHARSILTAGRPLPVTPAGEQFSIAALLYHLVTGVPYSDFGLERQDLYRRIAEAAPIAFTDRGLPPWPQLESVLHRAFARQPADRYASLRGFSRALEAVPDPVEEKDSRSRFPKAASLLAAAARALGSRAELGGPWLSEGLRTAPTASVTYGAAGIACGLYRIACLRGDPAKLALADVWARRAEREVGQPDGFYNDDQNLGPGQLETLSVYHSPSGVFAVAAMIARARNDRDSLRASLQAFLASADQASDRFDLTLGRAGILLMCALLRGLRVAETASLDELAHHLLSEIWENLEARPPMTEVPDEGLGMAHGWAGFLYATLQWCRVSGADLPVALPRRLDELAALAEPSGRGLEWRRRHRGAAPILPSSWCRGSAGQVFLWTLAARYLDDPTYEELAVGAGWHAWESPDLASSLCCGLAGRAYAMLRLYQHTGEKLWLDRACDLARRSARENRFEPKYPHSLYKGEMILAVLEADLENPDEAAMPFFEEEGWPTLG